MHAYYARPDDLEQEKNNDLKMIFKNFLNNEESAKFERKYERINTLFNLLDQWYETSMSTKDVMKAGDFIEFCKGRQITFSSSEINFLFSQILGED